MTSDVSAQAEAFVTPGTLLRSARMDRGLSEREVADLLNLMPNYVGILERDDYAALRSPAFARGYVRAYGQLMGLDETELLAVFDEQRDTQTEAKKRVETKSLQLQSTGLGVVVGLGILVILFAGLWWWQQGEEVGTMASDAPLVTPEGE